MEHLFCRVVGNITDFYGQHAIYEPFLSFRKITEACKPAIFTI